jgi:hypothetical protein
MSCRHVDSHRHQPQLDPILRPRVELGGDFLVWLGGHRLKDNMNVRFQITIIECYVRPPAAGLPHAYPEGGNGMLIAPSVSSCLLLGANRKDVLYLSLDVLRRAAAGVQ